MDQWPQRKRFRELVAAYRAAHGVSREEVAELLGLAESTLNNFLYTRSVVPGRDSILRAAAFFGVSITQLMDDPGAGVPGLAHKAFAKATEQDRSMIQDIFRDLMTLNREQKDAALDVWKASLKALRTRPTTRKG